MKSGLLFNGILAPVRRIAHNEFGQETANKKQGTQYHGGKGYKKLGPVGQEPASGIEKQFINAHPHDQYKANEKHNGTP